MSEPINGNGNFNLVDTSKEQPILNTAKLLSPIVSYNNLTVSSISTTGDVIITDGHLISEPNPLSPPTATFSSSSPPDVSLNSSANDISGVLNVTGTFTPDDIITVTFGKEYQNIPNVFLTPKNQSAFDCELTVTNVTVAGFQTIVQTAQDDPQIQYVVVE